MRKFFAIQVARLARFSSRFTKRGGGTTLPGLLAEKIDPFIVAKLAQKLPQGVILITGTNGKTTTAKMLSAILTKAGYEVIYNFSGSNLSRGIASLVTEHANFWGTKIKGQVGIFEVDEATLPEIANKIPPKLIVVTNLFRDQLDRYGELDKTASIIGSALQSSPAASVLLNADDPLVASLIKYNKNVKYFGINDQITTKSKGAIDSKDCLNCGHELEYKPRYFGHLGVYRCPNCNLARPNPEYILSGLKLAVETSEASFESNEIKQQISVQIPGLYNLYNALAAASVAALLGVSPSQISYGLSNVTAAFGRMEKVTIGNKKIFILLVKNPTGFTQAIETLSYDDKQKNLLMILNDNFADGTDISWIWDAEMEIIKDITDSAVVSGIRAEDLLLRLKYANFNMQSVMIEKEISMALDTALNNINDGETLYILPTYTAMLEVRKILKERNIVKELMER